MKYILSNALCMHIISACKQNTAGTTVENCLPLPTSREERGRQIAQRGGIKQVGSRYAVPSQYGASNAYIVNLVDETCTCADYELRRAQCKHLAAVYYSDRVGVRCGR